MAVGKSEKRENEKAETREKQFEPRNTLNKHWTSLRAGDRILSDANRPTAGQTHRTHTRIRSTALRARLKIELLPFSSSSFSSSCSVISSQFEDENDDENEEEPAVQLFSDSLLGGHPGGQLGPALVFSATRNDGGVGGNDVGGLEIEDRVVSARFSRIVGGPSRREKLTRSDNDRIGSPGRQFAY